MSAEDLGKRLVAEVEEERLDELLSTVRLLHDSTSQYRLGIPPIDDLCLLFAGQARPGGLGPDQGLDTHGQTSFNRRSPPIVELTSPSAGDGKLNLLYYITTMAVLPTHVSNVPLGGQNSAIVFLDTDNRFSVPRLVQAMRHYITAQVAKSRSSTNDSTFLPTASILETTITKALEHVHVFRPQSMTSLLSTLSSLQPYLFNTSAHNSSSRRIGAIILSSASSFYWSVRSESEIAALPSDNSAPKQQARTPSLYPVLAAHLRRLSLRFQTPVIYSTHTLFAIPPSSPLSHHQNHNQITSLKSSLPSPFPNLPSLRLVIQRRYVRKFPAATSAEEAVRDAGQRNEVVRKGIFDVCVNRWGEEDWGSRVREGLREMGGGGFEVRITGFGVDVEWAEGDG